MANNKKLQEKFSKGLSRDVNDKDSVRVINGLGKDGIKTAQDIKKIRMNNSKNIFSMQHTIRHTTDRYDKLVEEKESDENVAISATDESVVFARQMVLNTQKNKQPKLKFETSKDKLNPVSKQESSSQKLSHTKPKSAVETTKPNNKKQQKSSIKAAYAKDKNKNYTVGIKEKLKNVLKQAKEWMIKGLKKFAIYMIKPILMFIMASVIILAMVQAFSSSVSTIVLTSYQSSDLVVTNADVLYTRLEADILYAINQVEADYFGYDEYRYNVDSIGHDPHILIAYLTAKFGEFTDLDAAIELSQIFDLHYNYRLIEKVEIRYKTVTYISVNPETGETTSTTVQEAYEWFVLEVLLDTSNLEEIIISRLQEDEKDLYETLMVTKGNFISFPSPINEGWEHAVSSPFGYRLDPMSKAVTFHGGIDIAKPTGTELIAIMDGKVIKTGYEAEGYGNYIIIQAENSNQTVLYAHCNSIIASEGDEVTKGQPIATIGSTGKSTGPHLHLEIRDSYGNLLNPYFYLNSKIVEED